MLPQTKRESKHRREHSDIPDKVFAGYRGHLTWNGIVCQILIALGGAASTGQIISYLKSHYKDLLRAKTTNWQGGLLSCLSYNSKRLWSKDGNLYKINKKFSIHKNTVAPLKGNMRDFHHKRFFINGEKDPEDDLDGEIKSESSMTSSDNDQAKDDSPEEKEEILAMGTVISQSEESIQMIV